MLSRLSVAIRAGAVLGLGWSALVPVARLALGPTSRLGGAAYAGQLDRLPFETALTGVAAVVVLVGSAWLAAVTSVSVLAEVLSGWVRPELALARRVAGCAERVSPPVLRAAVSACVGVAALTSAVAPANADAAGPGLGAPSAGELTGLALPDRTTGGESDLTGSPSRRGLPRRTTVVVRSGDSLWSIAEQRLPPDASCAETADAMHRLYAANRRRVGADPDLIRPDTQLVLPQPLRPTHRKDRP